jgi:transcriptional regulator with XRE-family HTH domain
MFSALTQEHFAALCGIPHQTYKSIECKMNKYAVGRSPMSQPQAELIALVAGVDVKALRHNKLKCLNGITEYKREDWDAYQKKLSDCHEKIRDQIVKEYTFRIQNALEAADDAPACGPMLWYTSLAIELDKFYKNHEAIIFGDRPVFPSMISMLRKIIQDDDTRTTFDWAVEANKLSRPTSKKFNS